MTQMLKSLVTISTHMAPFNKENTMLSSPLTSLLFFSFCKIYCLHCVRLVNKCYAHSIHTIGHWVNVTFSQVTGKEEPGHIQNTDYVFWICMIRVFVLDSWGYLICNKSAEANSRFDIEMTTFTTINTAMHINLSAPRSAIHTRDFILVGLEPGWCSSRRP